MYTNQAGAAVGDQAFYPWGDAWLYWGVDGYNFASLDYYDTSTTTALTPFRVFSPNIGRWHSPDPLGGDVTNPQSLNRYAYVLNNPMTLTDPTGLNPCPTIGPGGSYACTPEQAAQSNVSGPAGSIYNGIAGANPFSLLYLMTSLMAEGSEPVLVNFGAWDLISPVFILVPDVKNDCQGPFARQRNYTLYQLQGGSLQPASNNYVWEVLQSQTNSGLSARLFGGGWTTQNLTNGATQGGFPDRVSIGTGAPATRIQNFMVSNVNPNTGNGQIWPASVALNNGNLVPAQTIVRASGQILIGGTAPKFFATSCGSLGD
jgi:RHS repeat-associated protein